MSAHQEKIFDFIEHAPEQGIYPSAVFTRRFKKAIPRGLRESIELELKRGLALSMADELGTGFLACVRETAEEIATNDAYDLLDAYLGSLANCFARDKLDLFESTARLALGRRRLSLRGYRSLLARLAEERRSILSELLPHDVFNQAFHAFAYRDGGEVRFFADARRELVQQRRAELELTGAPASPIFTKTCFYNYTKRLGDAKREFLGLLPGVFDEAYQEMLRALFALPARLSREEFDSRFGRFEGTEAAARTIATYRARWGVG